MKMGKQPGRTLFSKNEEYLLGIDIGTTKAPSENG